MKSYFCVSVMFGISLLTVAPAAAIEFEGGILGKLFSGEGCSKCKAEAPAAPAPTCDCPAPEPAPEPEPEALPCCEFPVLEAAPEPAPEPEPAVEVNAAPVCCCPIYVEVAAAPEPEPAPEPPAPACDCSYVVSEAASEPAAAEPIETIISETIISGGVLEATPAEPAASSEPASGADIFGPADGDGAQVYTPKFRLVFTPKLGWSKNSVTNVPTQLAASPTSTEATTAVLKKSTGKPAFRLSFTSSSAVQSAE